MAAPPRGAEGGGCDACVQGPDALRRARVTFSILDTPLSTPPVTPGLREASWNPALTAAIVDAPGIEPLLSRLSRPDALVVTTGQQPGLFTGPSYTVTKALSARALAAALERRWHRSVVPVYWVPGDDHDFEEVAHAAWLGADGELVRQGLPPRPSDAPMVSMSRQPLGNQVERVLEAFAGSFVDRDTSAPTVEWLGRHYRPEATVAGAFAGAMAELLAPYGVLVLDSTHPAVKIAAAPWILRALAASGEIDTELAGVSARLVSAGEDPGVPVGDGASLAFLETKYGRDRLVAAGNTFIARRGRESYTVAELERIAAKEPERLSGNVLLRPLIESAILPTVAYVAGPGELRYLALTPTLYERLGVTRQLPVPRWSGLLLEPRVERILKKFGAAVEELAADGGALESRLARQALPPGTEAALAALRAEIESRYAPVIRIAAAVDPTLERPAAAARGQALFGVERLEKKLLQHARKRESVELGQVARARLSVRPLGKPQERVLSMAGFRARYGDAVLGSLAEHIDSWYSRALEAAPRTP